MRAYLIYNVADLKWGLVQAFDRLLKSLYPTYPHYPQDRFGNSLEDLTTFWFHTRLEETCLVNLTELPPVKVPVEILNGLNQFPIELECLLYRQVQVPPYFNDKTAQLALTGVDLYLYYP